MKANFKQGSLWKLIRQDSSTFYYFVVRGGERPTCLVCDGHDTYLIGLTIHNHDSFQHCSLEEYKHWVPFINSIVNNKYNSLAEQVVAWGSAKQLTNYWAEKLNKKPTTEYEEENPCEPACDQSKQEVA